MEYSNDHRLTSYLNLLPDELILIIIEYVDISRNKTISSFVKEIEGVVNLSDRYKKLYNNYMKLIYDGIINYCNNFSYSELESSINYNYLESALYHIQLTICDEYDILFDLHQKYILMYPLQNINELHYKNIELHIIIINVNYYYINFTDIDNIYSADYALASGLSCDIKEYDNWKSLIKNLSQEDLSELFKSNGYEIINNYLT